MAIREVTRDGDQLSIRFDYDRRLVELVKGLPERKWHGEGRFWSVPVEHVVAVVELLKGEGFEIDEATLELYQEALDRSGDHLTVSQLNLQVKSALKGAFPSPIWLVGEIAGFGKSAHKDVVTFQLVERGEGGKLIASVDAVLFSDVRRLIEDKLRKEGDPFRLEDELTVRVRAEVDLYVPWGSYRVVIKDLDVSYTLGEVARRREEIVRKLTREGLSELNRSLPLPLLPLRVGLITSLGSDAEKDVLNTLRESGYAFQVTVHGARVQGPYTEPSVLNALDWFRAHAGEFDVVLICRGGGSRTDLAWFDSEALGRAVATFPLPVVVGIGHEQDFSVLDFLARRAKTPTAAAQLLVQRVRETESHVEEAAAGILSRAKEILSLAGREHRERARRLVRATGARLLAARGDLDRVARALPRAAGMALGGGRQYLAQARERLARAARREISGQAAELRRRILAVSPRAGSLLDREGKLLTARERRLRALDPRRVVERGFAILRLAGGGVVTHPRQAPSGARLRAELRGGKLRLVSQGGEPDDGRTQED